MADQNYSKKTKSKSKTTPETWQKRYNTSSGNQAKLFKRISNWYDALYAIVGVTPSPWRSKMYAPVLARQTWALAAKFLALKPGFQVTVNDPQEGPTDDIDEAAEKARRKLEYDWENPYMDETMRDKLFAPLLDAIVGGTGLAKVPWKIEKIDKYSRLATEDGTVDLSKEKKITKEVSYNDLEPINIFNVFVSPSAKNLYGAPWIIIKEFKPKADLEDINEDAGVTVYKDLDKLTGTTSFDDDMNSFNLSRNRMINRTDRVDNTVEMVKLFECYEGDTICTYAESQSDDQDSSWLLIREQVNPYWHGKYPLVRFTVRNKPFQFWGEGIFETTYRSQATYNDVFNHFMDQWNLAENSMLIAPERANVNDYVVEPGGVITYKGSIAPQQFKHDMPDPAQLQMLLQYIDQAIEGVTISQYAAGNPNSNADTTKGTAAGIEHLQKAAGDTVSFMRTNFTQSIAQIGRFWLSNNQQFMTEPLTLMVTTKGQKQPMTIKPQDLQKDMQLIIDDTTMDPAKQDERMARFMVYYQQLSAMQQASVTQAQETRWATVPMYLDYNSILQSYSELMNATNYDKLLLDKNTVMEAMQNAQTPWFMPHERFSIDLNELYGTEASQYLQRNGIQPDPSRQYQTPKIDPVAANLISEQTKQMAPAKTPQEQINYKDAGPYIRAQMEQQAGMDPDPSYPAQHAANLTNLSQPQQPANPQQPNAPTPPQGSGTAAQQPQVPSALAMNPQADQSVLQMAQQLAQQGHLDPGVLQHLSQGQGQPQQQQPGMPGQPQPGAMPPDQPQQQPPQMPDLQNSALSQHIDKILRRRSGGHVK
jgi:hypothetical protein